MLIDQIKGRVSYVRMNSSTSRSLNRQYDLKSAMIKIHVQECAEFCLQIKMMKLESRMNTQSADRWWRNSRRYDQIIKIMRKRLELCDRRLELHDQIPSASAYWTEDLEATVKLKQSLTDGLSVLTR